MDGLEIGWALNDEDRLACLNVRHHVFVTEQNVPISLEQDGLDKKCRHVLAWHEGQAIGAARIYYQESLAIIQRVCVRGELRGLGVGRDIMKFILSELGGNPNLKEVSLSSQDGAIPFYKALGFETEGAAYMEAGIKHQKMRLSLHQKHLGMMP